MPDIKSLLPISAAILVAGCGGGDPTEVTADSAKAFDNIGESETIKFTGNEPFWNGELSGGRIIYKTPENMKGVEAEVKRFAGLNGLGFSGTLDGAQFDMIVTPGACNDSMSDRKYPFVITLNIGGELRNGCGWTDKTPYTTPENGEGE